MAARQVASGARVVRGAHTCRREWLYEIVGCIQPRVVQGAPAMEELSMLAATAASEFERQVVAGLLARLKQQQALVEASAVTQVADASGASEGTIDLGPRVMEAVLTAKQILDEQYAHAWTLERLARRVGCNRTDLEVAFARLNSCTIHRYQTFRRIEAAKKALRDTPWVRLTAIAEAVGYRSKMSFFSNFKRVVGMTPDEYRSGWTLRPVSASIERALQRAVGVARDRDYDAVTLP